jgi:hypothetical protein
MPIARGTDFTRRLGVRPGLRDYGICLLGVNTGAALAVSLSVGVMTLLVSLPGTLAALAAPAALHVAPGLPKPA